MPPPRRLPPRRLLAIAASLALLGSGQADAGSRANQKRQASLDGSETVCPLGTFHCAPRPDNYALCRPNALLEFYDPTLSKDPDARATALTRVWAKNIDGSDQTVYHLYGDVKLDRADQQLQADRVAYNDDTTDYDATGHVRYQDYSQLLAATHMRGNDQASTGTRATPRPPTRPATWATTCGKSAPSASTPTRPPRSASRTARRCAS